MVSKKLDSATVKLDPGYWGLIHFYSTRDHFISRNELIDNIIVRMAGTSVDGVFLVLSLYVNELLETFRKQ